MLRTDRRPHQIAALTGVVLAILLAACSNSGGGPERPTARPTAIATITGVGALPLERFNYVAALTLRETATDQPRELLISTEGTFQWPDRHAFTYTTQLGEGVLRQRVVIIGETAWFKRGDEAWRETTRDDPQVAGVLSSAFSAVRPNFLGGAELDRVRVNVRDLPSTLEFVNSIRAHHYRVGPEGREFFRAFLGDDQALNDVEEMQWDLWLSQEGAWPVRLSVSGIVTVDLKVLDELDLQAPTLWDLRIDVSRPNDPELFVSEPQTG